MIFTAATCTSPVKPGTTEGKVRTPGREWFSGTLVVGTGTELEEGDKHWMIRDKMDFRIKMDLDSTGRLIWKAYYIDFPEVSLEL